MTHSDHSPKGVPWGWIVAGLVVIALISFFFMRGVGEGVQYYMTVSEYFQQQQKYNGKHIKLAGRVKMGSLSRRGKNFDFIVEDQGKDLHVHYEGLAPDTFKDGVEVVVEGKGKTGDSFLAKGLMAKCASKYQEGGLPPLEQMRSRSIK